MVESCNLVLYDRGSHTGTAKYYNGNKDLRARGEADRDHSAKLTGSCKNTSYLVFEHPWDHKGENGGLAYLIGESDNPRDMDRPGVTTNPIGSRYWKRHGRADNIVRINIPSENINEGRMRQDIKVMGKSNSGDAGDTLLHLYRDNNGNPNASDQWLTGTYNDQNSIKKGQPCPGGDAYWKNAMDSKISCVYDVKTGDKLGRIRTLHSEISNSTIPNDPRKTMFDKIAKDYCDRADRLDDKVTSGSGDDSTCRGFSNAKKQMKDWCIQGDKIKTDTMLCTSETDSLGPTLYDELAAKYCDSNSDDPFCGCYNVVTNKCKGEEIDKEIKRLEDARKPIEGVRYVWFGFDDKIEYLNIAQIEVYSGGVNIVKDIDDSKVTVGSTYETSDNKYVSDHLFDGNYDTFYHSALEAGWKTTSNKRYNLQNLKGQYVSLGSGADVSYNAELGDDEDASVADCKKACVSLPKCKSILYNKRGKSCHMLSATTADTSTLSNTNNDIIEKIGDSQHNYVKIDLGKDYTIDSVKIFNRKSCGSKEANNICNDRWAGSYVKLLRSNGSLIKASEKVVGDYKQGGERVISFFDNGVGAAKAKSLIPGCKITVPLRRTLMDLPSRYYAAFDGTDKCWGNVCSGRDSEGGKTFVPKDTVDALCSKSVTICNVELKVGDLEDSQVNIEQSCGEQEGTPAPMGSPSFGEPSEPSDGSTDGTPAPMGGTPSVPSTSSSSSTPAPTSSSTPTEELEIYEKPAFQIGTVASSLVSVSSCALLIILAM